MASAARNRNWWARFCPSRLAFNHGSGAPPRPYHSQSSPLDPFHLLDGLGGPLKPGVQIAMAKATA